MRHMLMGSALRAYAPENDEGSEVEDLEDEILEDEGEESEDELEDDDEPVGEVEVDEPERPVKKSAQQRTADATRIASEARAETARLRQELEQERASRNQTSDAERQRQRNEHLATLTGDQRADFLRNEDRQQTQRELQQIRFENYDANDRAAFESLAAKTPAIRAVAAKVEEELGRIRAGGGNVSREVVAKYVLGDMAMAKATRSNNAGAKRSQSARERTVTRPSSGRSDVAATRSRGGTDMSKLVDRLRDVKL